jgi:hypothetical protein
MHLDLAHALVSGVLVLGVVLLLQKTGHYVPRREGGPRWSWPLFAAIFVVVLILNLVWPYGP